MCRRMFFSIEGSYESNDDLRDTHRVWRLQSFASRLIFNHLHVSVLCFEERGV